MTVAAVVPGSGPAETPGSVWRVCKSAHAELDGEGARLYGGRWNRPGSRIVYASGSLSLAALEYFVHLDADLAPDDLVSLRLEIPRDLALEALRARNLPADWRSYPAPLAVQALGTEWAALGETAILAVPSVVIPEEWNYLLNPAHADFSRVRAGARAPFSFDPRMWK